jgi:hypothetical protein
VSDATARNTLGADPLSISSSAIAAILAAPAGRCGVLDRGVIHVGSTKLMYDESAFGEARRRWSDPIRTGGVTSEGDAAMPSAAANVTIRRLPDRSWRRNVLGGRRSLDPNRTR